MKSVFKGDFYIAQTSSSQFLRLIMNKNQLITKAGSLPGARARLIFQYLRKMPIMFLIWLELDG